MTPREEQQPHDLHKMCKQAERDHESRKLIVLMERVKRQLRDHTPGSHVQLPKPPVAALSSNGARTPTRSFFER